LKRDQKFFDMYSLVIGILAIFSVGIFVLAMKMSDLTQGVYTTSAEEYQGEIRNRMQPFGAVYLPGDDLVAESTGPLPSGMPEPVATTLTGPQVYNEACIACHGGGIGGAPTLADTANWEPRIAQGLETLQRHAIEGYTGSAGYMPPKGGRLDLSDEEIDASVEYMVNEVQN
jgi:cytochrome c5